jgi:ATP-dependent protease ClpP protease subunit
MDRIDVGDRPVAANSRERYFARAKGTAFEARAPMAGAAAEIELYDEIGMWGITARDLSAKLADIPGDVVVRINSPGGNVFEGITMFNELLAHKAKGTVRVEIMGIAASIASVVAMAGDEIAIAENGFMMIHNAWIITGGNRHDLNETATVLAKIDQALARTYANRAGLGVRTIGQMMDEETWLTGPDAIAKGFATESLSAPAGAAAEAKFDLSVFACAPEALRWAEDVTTEPTTIRDVERELMRDAGPRSRSQARAIMRACKTAPADEGMPDAAAAGLQRLLASLKQVGAPASH